MGLHGILSCGRMQVKMLRKRSADENAREETGQGNDQEYGEVNMAKRKTELWKGRLEGWGVGRSAYRTPRRG